MKTRVELQSRRWSALVYPIGSRVKIVGDLPSVVPANMLVRAEVAAPDNTKFKGFGRTNGQAKREVFFLGAADIEGWPAGVIDITERKRA